MLPIAYYFLQVILCTALMMGYYWLVLRNKRFHQYNRFYLLAITVLAWIVPLIKIKWGHAAVNSDPLQFLSIVADSNSEIESFTRKGFHWDWEVFAGATYFVVAGILLIGMIRAFSKLYQLLNTHSCKSVGDVYLILTQAQGTPFSFFRYIFWNEEIDIRSESGKQILEHELTHVQQKHSFDKLLIQVVLIAGWFNPFFWLIKKELEMIHEFIADRKAVHNGDTSSLAQMLLTAAYPQQQFMLTNPFFFSPIKRRLQMLTNNHNPRFSYIRRLVVLPLLGIVVVLFAFRNKEEKQLTLSVATVVEKAVEKGRQMIAVEDIPLKPVAKKDTIIIQANTVYIQSKDKNDIIKIVPLNSLGTADKPLIILDGKKVPYSTMSTLDANLINSVDILKGESATSTMYGEEGKNGIVIITTKAQALKKPLMIIDGKRVDNYLLSTMNPDLIKQIDVFKNDSASAKYGEEGKNGVIVVTTKSNAPSYGATVTITPHSDPDKPTTLYDRRDKEGNLMMPLSGMTLGSSAKQYKSPVSVRNLIKENVLIIVDGNRVGPTALETLDPVSISSVNVLKDSSARVLYGEEAKEGVIVITTKAKAAEYNKQNPRKPAYEGYPVFTQTQIPAHFPGGEEAWQKYLQRNLNRDMIVEKGGPPGKYTVVVSFIIDKEGTLSDIRAENDPGYGTKEEAIRMIEKGPNWVPAEQNGKKVIYRHKQRITWVVSESDMDLKSDGKKEPLKNPKKTEREIVFEKKLQQEKANNSKTFFYINGISCVITGSGSRAEMVGATDIVFVNGKRMTPDELNKKYNRNDFMLVAANDTDEAIKKYGKGALLVSSKRLTPKEVNAQLDLDKYEPK
jgi:hypothetical protein